MILSRRWYLVTVLAALQVLDVTTTLAVIGVGGIEGNPLMRNIAHGNPWYFLAVKLSGVALVALLAWRITKSRLLDSSLTFVVVAYLAIVGWNLYNLNAIGAT